MAERLCELDQQFQGKSIWGWIVDWTVTFLVTATWRSVCLLTESCQSTFRTVCYGHIKMAFYGIKGVGHFERLFQTEGAVAHHSVLVSEWLPFCVVSKYPQCIVQFCHNPRMWQTDGQNYNSQDCPCICSRSNTGISLNLLHLFAATGYKFC